MYLGVDIGGTKILAGLVSAQGQVVSTVKIKTDAQEPYERLVGQIKDSISVLLRKESVSIGDIKGIGIGVPGLVKPEDGMVVFAPNLGWRNVPLKAIFQDALQTTVVITNDVNAGIIGETWKGSGRGRKDVVGIFVGTGVGGAVIVDGRIWLGTHKLAGEVGHMILNPEGPKCSCGNNGCLEAYVGKVNITKNLIAAGIDVPGGSIVKSSYLASAIKDKNPIVKKELKRVSSYLAVGISNLTALLNPELVILGGGVVEACSEYILPKIKKKVKEISYNKAAIMTAKLGDHAGIIGAAKIALDVAANTGYSR
ncbi:MAG: hypothetical protein DKM50_12770 [Candidatus Margulisiibacteriota bacterium]|nr:MAG: hypothetical protein A2X43_01250 [Candidatus Margulisbacteria bacterium GWD2_39_127]OGI05355.1 MAG: hypothetical protein A2X42_05880 [Candidatus Margulisbacteria bacterium GWF2_38_17]OGI05812.1 MAG: hypothetical protein A2X41_02740 [Candidatus Margulisbacteria bacterium GWE2_39_32]PZM77408.1 MAG: hypothetical protein DKM50_12770 [Candidatus Margulisiibacteriota bacterium]HAR62284.1 hypothetical protein [Candidatus Margulisiibacteriota bacterium]